MLPLIDRILLKSTGALQTLFTTVVTNPRPQRPSTADGRPRKVQPHYRSRTSPRLYLLRLHVCSRPFYGNLPAYRSSWVESLGDLARYLMAISGLVIGKASHSASLGNVAMLVSAGDTRLVKSARARLYPR